MSPIEAIIDRKDFDLIQRILAMDTRTSPGGRAAEIFSGMVYCGECGGPMVRKTVPSGKKKYVYYVCGTHKNEKRCFCHSLSDAALKEIVRLFLQTQIQGLIDASRLPGLAEAAFLEKSCMKKLQMRLVKNQEEAGRYQRLLDSLYESLAEGVIDKEEYRVLKRKYKTLLAETERAAEEVCVEMDRRREEEKNKSRREQLEKLWNIPEPDRAMAVIFIEKIFIYRDKKVEIVCNWKDEWKETVVCGENEKEEKSADGNITG